MDAWTSLEEAWGSSPEGPPHRVGPASPSTGKRRPGESQKKFHSPGRGRDGVTGLETPVRAQKEENENKLN